MGLWMFKCYIGNDKRTGPLLRNNQA